MRRLITACGFAIGAVLLAAVAPALGGGVSGGPIVDRPPVESGWAAGQEIPPAYFQQTPLVLQLADLGTIYDSAAITDIAIGDLDRDGAADIVAAWYATDAHDTLNNLRYVTVFYGDGNGAFVRGSQFNLLVRDTSNYMRSVFANGTAALALGDFDGDGDKDIAVTAYFGDEIWFIENLGGRNYTPRFKYVFNINTTGNNITPPEAIAADFDGDGRDDLAYIIDPTLRINFVTIVFWRTSSALANIYRVGWDGADVGFPVSYTRGLAAADFNNDNRPDLCFTGVTSQGTEIPPAVAVIWYGLNTSTRLFNTSIEYPPFVCSDVQDVRSTSLCDPLLVFSDRNGTQITSWNSTCGAGVDYAQESVVAGFSGVAVDRGMTVVSADLNRDAVPDLVTRQRSGATCDRVEIALGMPGLQDWLKQPSSTISTCGFSDVTTNQILRPRNLAVGDLFWSADPEIVAAFGPSGGGPAGLGRLEIAIWPNGCRGDINHDGGTDVLDLTILLSSLNCVGSPNYRPEADLNRSGCVDFSDLTLLLADYGCSAGPS
ncbi:MAG: VCBS repeat-containing protein [Planctomycetes bacterium]|nr:VCBS repeat-containing protein [Planctomycetota bacterium]